jgi:hypothetical protein
MWPVDKADDTADDLEQYGRYRDALDAPFLKESLLRPPWRGWVEGYAHVALARLVFRKIQGDNPDADELSIAHETKYYLSELIPNVDLEYLRIFFPTPQALISGVHHDPLRSLIASMNEHDVMVDTFACPYSDDADENVSVALSTVDLVQCEDIAWEQIAEIRKDETARRELSELRHFIFAEFEHDSADYVADKLQQAVDDHRRAALKWGLTTLPSNLKIDCEANTAMSVFIALGCLTAGATLPLLAAAGTIVPLAQALISIHKGRKLALKNSKVGYLVRLQDAVASSHAAL